MEENRNRLFISAIHQPPAETPRIITDRVRAKTTRTIFCVRVSVEAPSPAEGSRSLGKCSALDSRRSGTMERSRSCRARSALAAGASVIVDAVHARLEERRAIEAVAAGAGAPFAGFWLEAPKQTLGRRVARRGSDVSDATVDVVELQDRHAIGEVSWRRISSLDEPTAVAEQLREFAAGATTSST